MLLNGQTRVLIIPETVVFWLSYTSAHLVMRAGATETAFRIWEPIFNISTTTRFVLQYLQGVTDSKALCLGHNRFQNGFLELLMEGNTGSWHRRLYLLRLGLSASVQLKRSRRTQLPEGKVDLCNMAGSTGDVQNSKGKN